MAHTSVKESHLSNETSFCWSVIKFSHYILLRYEFIDCLSEAYFQVIPGDLVPNQQNFGISGSPCWFFLS